MTRVGKTLAAGYSLIELMVVIAIIGIIATIAYPSYQGYTCDTYRAQAVADLQICALGLDRYFSNDFTYVGAVIDGTAATVCPNTSPASGTAKFDISLQSALATSYEIRATPAAGQSCGEGTTITLVTDGTIDEI